jgi:hypothetical protein
MEILESRNSGILGYGNTHKTTTDLKNEIWLVTLDRFAGFVAARE